MTKTVWLQNADFNTVVEDTVKNDVHVIGLLESYDWKEQLTLEEEMEGRGEECCPAGIGIVDGASNAILHLCPRYEGLITIHWLKNALTQWTVENVPRPDAREAIRRFLASDHAWFSAFSKRQY